MFGDQLRFFRKQANFTQTQLAEMIGCPQTTLSDWERNKSEPSFTVALKIAHVLNIDPAGLGNAPKKTNL